MVRGESYLWIAGKVLKDDGTLNVMAEQIRALELRRAPVGVHTSPSHPPSENGGGAESPRRSPYAFLKRLRRNAPGAKSWG